MGRVNRDWLTLLITLAIGVVVVVAVTVTVAVLWMRQAQRTIRYRGHDYINPITSSSAAAAKWQPLEYTSERRRGMRLLIPRQPLAVAEVPTAILAAATGVTRSTS